MVSWVFFLGYSSFFWQLVWLFDAWISLVLNWSQVLLFFYSLISKLWCLFRFFEWHIVGVNCLGFDLMFENLFLCFHLIKKKKWNPLFEILEFYRRFGISFPPRVSLFPIFPYTLACYFSELNQLLCELWLANDDFSKNWQLTKALSSYFTSKIHCLFDGSFLYKFTLRIFA